MNINIFQICIGWIKTKSQNGTVYQLKFVNQQKPQIDNPNMMDDIINFF